MKKRNGIFAAAVVMALCLTGCGSKEYLKDIDASRYVTLGNYMGIEVAQNEPEVMDGFVDMYIDYIREQNAVSTEVTGRAVQEGDTVSIDYAGYLDGVAFDGGTGSNDLTIGSHSFIDGFEDGLIGHELGEHVSLNLTFPDPYENNPDLAGAEVVFEVDINGIYERQIPELDDAYVQSLGVEELQTVEDLKDYVYDIFYQEAVSVYESSVTNALMNSIMANCTFKKLPDDMLERFKGIVSESGNYNAATDAETIEADALELAQQYVVVAAIADAEGIAVTDEDVDAKVEELVTAYNYSSVEDFKEQTDMETFREYMLADKVMAFLRENASIHPVEEE